MTDPAAPTTRQLGCGYCAPCELDADHDGPHSMGMYSEWQVPTIEPMAFIHPARSTPAEALPNDHACDWPGCAGQCHTGSTCPCHPSTPAEPFDEAQAWADMAARRGDPELGTPAAPTPLRALHDAYYAVPAGEPTAEQIMENLPDLYAAIERVLEDAGRISGMLATVDEAERNGLTVHLATRRTCREHIKAGDDHA